MTTVSANNFTPQSLATQSQLRPGAQEQQVDQRQQNQQGAVNGTNAEAQATRPAGTDVAQTQTSNENTTGTNFLETIQNLQVDAEGRSLNAERGSLVDIEV